LGASRASAAVAVIVLSACIAAPYAGGAERTTPARTSPAITTTSERLDVVVHDQRSTDSLTWRDLLVALTTLGGAALGFLGAVTGARLAAASETRRAREEAAERHREALREQTVARVDELVRSAGAVIEDVTRAVQTDQPTWAGQLGHGIRSDLRLRATTMLGLSALLGDSAVEEGAGALAESAVELSNAVSVAAVRAAAAEVADRYGMLLTASRKLVDSGIDSS
jgi:hypothetical protein